MNSKKENRRKRIARVLALVLALAMIASTAFYLLMFVGTLFGVEPSGVAYGLSENSVRLDIRGMDLSELDISRLENLPQLMEAIKTLYKDDVTYTQLIEGLYSGMFDTLDDEWSEYYFKGDDTLAEMDESLSSEFCGIGVSVQMTDGGIRIISIIADSPAAEASLRIGGIIEAVDDRSVADLDLNTAANLLRGKEGTTVKIRVRYPEGSKTYILERRKIENPSVSGKMAENTTGYIKIDSFSEKTASEFKKLAKQLKSQGMDRLVIDLRNNGGGYVDQAWEIAGMLIPKGQISGYYIARGEVTDTFTAKGSEFDRMPLVLLVNEYTASASEMLAIALKDAGRAVAAGEVTYGKGVAQGTWQLNNGDSMKLSLIYFTGRNKQPIHGVGIVPDHIVYTYGGYTQSEAAALLAGLVVLSDDERFYEGEEGLNVLAAQQRLQILGYDVKPTGIMDRATMDALRKVQRAAGSYSYGNLDNFTIKALREQFNALLGFDGQQNHADAQLAKALEVVKTIK